MSLHLSYEVWFATVETVYMVLASTFFAVLFGLPLGTLLFTTDKIKPNRVLNQGLAGLINFLRSIPFIILLVAIIPFTRLLVGSSIGIHAAMVPLSLGAIPFFARLVDNAFQNVSPGLIEAGFAMGTNSWQIILYFLIPEAMPSLINATTVTAIALVNYSAMAGTVGGGGLGDLAIRYGYHRFDAGIMVVTVAILVLLVQAIQFGGDRLARRFNHE